MNGFKIRIPIQSVSDIITNSSSEVFCRISSDNKEITRRMFETLLGLLGNNRDYYEVPRIKLLTKEEAIEEEWYDKDYIDTLPETWIEIDLPYGLSNLTVFFEKGITSFLDVNYKDNYNIEIY